MTYEPDFQEMNAIHQKAKVERKGRINRRVHTIMLRAGDRLESSEQDMDIEAIEALLGIKPGGKDKAMELLGVKPSNDVSEPETEPLSKFVKAFDENDREVDAALREDIAKITKLLNQGFMPVEDRGVLVKLQMPKGLTPAPVQPGDLMVPKLDKKGNQVGTISVKNGHADPDFEAIGDPETGLIDHFKEKPRAIRRRQ